jgi:uncharacterized protein (DUF697 family)
VSWLETLEDIRKKNWTDATAAERKSAADEVVAMSAYAGALTAVVPVPIADLALLLPVHSAMVMTVGHIHARPVGEAEAKRIVLELGAVGGLAFAGHAAIGALRRLLVPAVGGLLGVSATFALTWAVGQVAIAYFSDPHLSREQLRTLFKEAMREGATVFSAEAFERFRQGQPQGAESAGSPEGEAPAPDAPEGQAGASEPEPAAREGAPDTKAAPTPAPVSGSPEPVRASKPSEERAPEAEPTREAREKAASLRPKKREM